ncbi:MAG: transporter substrate-binding domain-containing protein [Kiritimatiellia bacterium]|jgi:polar amino acid transport system substrate-binding protein|nr:transporter substrate-binding domain-containing protein [Kiritimatiellia bacterium]
MRLCELAAWQALIYRVAITGLLLSIPRTSPARDKLLLAVEDYPPFEYMEAGEPRGINIEVTDRIMKKLGIPYQVRFYPFSRGWMMFKKGSADFAPSISYKPQREPHIYYTQEQREFPETRRVPRDYLWMTEYVFFINKRFSDSLKYESLEQLKKDKYRVAVLSEYTYEPDFQAADLDKHMFVNPIDAFRALIKGAVDVVPFDRTVGTWLLENNGIGASISTLPKPLFYKPYLMCFSKASRNPDIESISKAFYRELAAMRLNGEYDEIYAKYIPPSSTVQPPRPLLFVCEEWAPFEYFGENGKLTGIDVEVVARIMKQLNIPYSIRIYPWSRAWMMVQKGGADAVLSISYKESREDVLYYTEGQRAFATTGEIPQDFLWKSQYVFFVKKKNVSRFQFESFEQIKKDGYRIGTNKDYSYNPAFLAAQLGDVTYNDTKAGLLGLVSEEVDLYPMDRTVGLAALSELGLTDSVTFLPKPIFSKPYLAPFCRRSSYPAIEEVMKSFNVELLRMRNNNDYSKICDKYFDALKPAK